jgi:hypothetical protein
MAHIPSKGQFLRLMSSTFNSPSTTLKMTTSTVTDGRSDWVTSYLSASDIAPPLLKYLSEK